MESTYSTNLIRAVKRKSQIQRKYAQNIDLIIILVFKIHCALLKLHRGLGTGYSDEGDLPSI